MTRPPPAWRCPVCWRTDLKPTHWHGIPRHLDKTHTTLCGMSNHPWDEMEQL